MNTTQAEVRTKETSELLREVDSVLATLHVSDFGNALSGAELSQVWREIDRARRQFDAKLFFIVVFGPLKAGKSTLTNTLAGEYVSPAGFGIETTRRPSLVISAEESGIDQYFSTDAEVNHFLSQRRMNGVAPASLSPSEEDSKIAKVRDAFDMVADYLRGITKKQDGFQGRIRITSLPLSVPNLEQTLTLDLRAEPLFTVIRCKGGHLLNQGVAIVDMPGLDGSRSNWRDDPIHEWVIKRAEFFLFVQSSVAALNRETRDFVQQVLAQSTKPPIWLIQNMFDARHWQPEEKTRKSENEQREEGKRRVMELLGEAPRSVLPINLGLAWDGKNEKQEEWLTKSAFPECEKDLSQILRSERGKIQERNSLTNLHQRLSNAVKKTAQIADHIAEVRDRHNKLRNNLVLAQTFLDKVDCKTSWEAAITGEILNISAGCMKDWFESLVNEINSLEQRHDRYRSGKEVNGALEVVATRLAAEGGIRHFLKPSILPKYCKMTDQFCTAAESKAVDEVNKMLCEMKMPKCPDPVPPTTDDLPLMIDHSFSTDKLKESPKWNPFWITKHDGATNLSFIANVAKDWRQQIEARSKLWGKQLLANHFSVYCEKRRAHYRAHIQSLLVDFEVSSKAERDAATNAESLIKQINQALANLAIPVANAVVSMK